jgi:maleate isomerase
MTDFDHNEDHHRNTSPSRRLRHSFVTSNKLPSGTTTGNVMVGSETDSVRYGWRLRLGMLVPSSNRVVEPELPSMLPQGVAVHTTRLRLVGGGPDELLAMTEKVEEAAELVAHAGVDLIVFHCTAVSTFDVGMEATLKARITKTTGKPAIATSEALVAAFRELGARRIVLLSPYPSDVNEREVAFFHHHQISVVHEVGLNLQGGGGAYSDVDPAVWYRLAMANRRDSADAYFLSCTTIRTAPVIAMLERDLGKPVVTSNQAMIWHALRTGGVRDKIAGFGELLTR